MEWLLLPSLPGAASRLVFLMHFLSPAPSPALSPTVHRILLQNYRRVSVGFPCDSDGKESACNAGDLGLIPGLGRSPEGNGNPFQYSGLENSMGRETCWATVHGITKNLIWLSDCHFTSPVLHKTCNPHVTGSFQLYPFNLQP